MKHAENTKTPSSEIVRLLCVAWRCLEFLQLHAGPYSWSEESAPVAGKQFYRALVMIARLTALDSSALAGEHRVIFRNTDHVS